MINLITVIHSSSHAHIKTSVHQRKGQTSLSMEMMRITYMVSHITSADLQVCQCSEWHVAFILSQIKFYEAQLCITEPEVHRRNFEIGQLLCTWRLISLWEILRSVEVALLQSRHWEAVTTIFGLSLGHRTRFGPTIASLFTPWWRDQLIGGGGFMLWAWGGLTYTPDLLSSVPERGIDVWMH